MSPGVLVDVLLFCVLAHLAGAGGKSAVSHAAHSLCFYIVHRK